MNIFTYFKNMGIDTIDSSFYSQIKMWESWYNGNVRKFHYYHVYNGKNKIRCRRLSLGMAKKVSEDIADLLLNERVKITIGNSDATNTYVQEVLNKNKFLVKGNDYQERKAYTGTVAYVLQIKNAETDQDGNVMGGEIFINYVQAKNIFPISWDNGEVTEVAFLFPKTVNRKKYALIQFHRLKDVEGVTQYVIENHVVQCTSGAGTEVPPEKWGELKPFESLSSEIKTGSDKPQFVIDRLNIVNNADEDDTNPMGMAIFANSIDTLAKIDMEYDSYANEFSLGRKRIFVAPEMLSDMLGNPVFDENDTVFYQLPEDTDMGNNPIKEVNMELRADQHSKAINDDLNFLSFKCGFGTERYRFEKGSVATATQVISENSDMYRSLQKHEIILENVIKELIGIIIRMGIVLRVPELSEDVEISIDFDDSIIEDKTAERQQDRQDVSMGVMRHEEYRAKWYGETKEEARKNLPEQNQVMDESVAIPKSAGAVAEVQGRSLNGAQTQSLIAIMSQYTAGELTEGQAVNLIATAIGIEKEEARKILNGDVM